MSISPAHPNRQARNLSPIVGRLFNSMRQLPAPQLKELLDALAGEPAVAAAGWRIRERRLSQRLHAERDQRIAAFKDKGLSYSEIARVFNMKPRAVARACQRFRRRGDNDSLSPPGARYAS